MTTETDKTTTMTVGPTTLSTIATEQHDKQNSMSSQVHSPTSVNEAETNHQQQDLVSSSSSQCWNDNDNSIIEPDASLPLDVDDEYKSSSPFDVVVHEATMLWNAMQFKVHQAQKSFTLDRPFIMSCMLICVTGFILFVVFSICCVGAIALVSMPLWFPLALLTSPLWLFGLLVSSPVWVVLLVVLATVGVTSTTITCTLVVFMCWPEEWLPNPNKGNNNMLTWLLNVRAKVELQLLKWQAKLLLYAAGVGPAADAAMVMLERIDLQAVRDRLAKVNVEKLKRMDVSELQALLMEAMASLVKQ